MAVCLGQWTQTARKYHCLACTRDDTLKPTRLIPPMQSGNSTYLFWTRQSAQAQLLVPYDGRCIFAGKRLDNGAHIVTVQKHMGHSNPKITASADGRTERARTEAVNTVTLVLDRSPACPKAKVGQGGE
jgi:hypothetical protein